MSDERADESDGSANGSEERGDAPDDDWFERALREAENADEDLFSDKWSPEDFDDELPDSDAASRNASADRAVDDLESAFEGIADDERAEFDAASEDPPDADATAAFEAFPEQDDTFDEVPKPDENDDLGDRPTTDADAADADADRADEGTTDEQGGGKTDEQGGGETDEQGGEEMDEQDDDGDLFETDFASALGDAPDLPGESGGAAPDSGATGQGSSTGGVGGSPTGAGGFGGGGEFDMASDDVGALGDLDDVGAPGGGSDFEQQGEDYESDIPRIELGVEGLDAMIQGGVPERSLMVAIGSAGTGKTTLGLQFLDQGLQQGERAVYITLEESRRRVIRSATEKGFPFDEYLEEDRLAVVDIDPIEMANSLQSIRSELSRLIEEFDASRLVLDSVSLLEMMYDERAVRRNEIYDFTKSLKRAGVTTLLTSEASEDSAFASRHGIVEYLTDAVFVLQYVRPSDFRETRLAIEIQKIRDANHSRETKPYEITNDGINVYRRANIF